MVFLIIYVIFKSYKRVLLERFNVNKTTKKIAFMFLTIGDIHKPHIWKRFFKNNKNRYSIYIHPKYPKQVTSFFKKYIINDLVDTRWGDVSLVNATNKLIHTALQNPNNHKLILVSNSCIPIKNFNHIYQLVLQNKKSWFNYYIPNLKQGSRNHYYRIKSLKLPIINYAVIHEQWMILDRTHAEILDANTYLLKHFNIKKLIPDEMYYLTALHYLQPNIFKQIQFPLQTRKTYLQHNNITYAKWYNPITKIWQIKHPVVFDKMSNYDLKVIKQSNALFARKFSKKSNIDKYWSDIVSIR